MAVGRVSVAPAAGAPASLSMPATIRDSSAALALRPTCATSPGSAAAAPLDARLCGASSHAVTISAASPLKPVNAA